MVKEIDISILRWIEVHKIITIRQCARMFYQGEYAYDRARKKLAQMLDKGLIKSYQNSLRKSEKIYYMQDKLSSHDVLVYDFYSKLVEFGCSNIKIDKEPRYLNGLLRADCYFEVEFEGYIYYIILEVDLTHFTSMSKFQLYEKMYRDRELKDQCMTFPQIVVMGINSVRYESKQLEVVYLPFSLEGFEEVLGIEESAITD